MQVSVHHVFLKYFLNRPVYFVVFSNFHVLFGGPQLFHHGPPLLNLKGDAVNDEFKDCEILPPDSPSPIIELEGPHSHPRGSSDIEVPGDADLKTTSSSCNEIPDGGLILNDNDDEGI